VIQTITVSNQQTIKELTTMDNKSRKHNYVGVFLRKDYETFEDASAFSMGENEANFNSGNDPSEIISDRSQLFETGTFAQIHSIHPVGGGAERSNGDDYVLLGDGDGGGDGLGERAKRESDESDSREMATDMMATSTTKLTLFHSKSFRLDRFALAPLRSVQKTTSSAQ